MAALAVDPPGLTHDVGLLVGRLSDALALREAGHVTSARVALFAADPAAALLSHLPDLAADAADALAGALDEGGALLAVVRAPGRTTFGFGTSPGPTLALTLDTTGATPAVGLSGE